MGKGMAAWPWITQCIFSRTWAVGALLVLGAFSGSVAAESSGTGMTERLMSAFGHHPSRMPGSSGFEASAQALESEFRRFGLPLRRQVFPSVVPATTTCRLDVDGQDIIGILPLGPNGPALTTTWGATVDGPLVVLGNRGPEAWTGIPLRGTIAVIDLGNPHQRALFSQGVRAVILVDRPGVTQQQAMAHATDFPLSMPVLWISQEAAVQAGLTDARAGRTARVTIATRWQDVQAMNLWAVIPAASGAPAESAAQTLVLSADLDSTGLVPERSPSLRLAANVALLAEVAERLRAAPIQRQVLVVFLGSHHIMQEGSRHLAHAIHRINSGSRAGMSFADRAKNFRSELARREADLAILDDPALLSRTDRDAFDLVLELKRSLVVSVNNLHYDIRTRKLALGRTVDHHTDPQLMAFEERKKTINNLRGQLHEGVVTDRTTLNEALTQLRHHIAARRDDAHAGTVWASSGAELVAALVDSTVVGHIDFNFSSSHRPWTLNPDGMLNATQGTPRQVGVFAKQQSAAVQAFTGLPAGTLPALIMPPAGSVWPHWNLCTPASTNLSAGPVQLLGLYGVDAQTVADPLADDGLPTPAPAPDLRPLAPGLHMWLSRLAEGPWSAKTGLPRLKVYDGKSVAEVSEGGHWRGLQVLSYAKGSEESAGPASRALVVIGYPRDVPPPLGQTSLVLGRVGPAGYLRTPGICDSNTWESLMAMGFHDHGGMAAMNVKLTADTYSLRVFQGFGGAITLPFKPKEYLITDEMRSYEAASDSLFKRMQMAPHSEASLVFVDRDRPLRIIGNGIQLLGLGQGRGGMSSAPADLLGMDTVAQTARDVTRLNQERLDILRAKDIPAKPIEKLHAEAQGHLEDAAQARSTGQSGLAMAHEMAANLLSYRAYDPLRSISDDLLRAVVVLLVLSIPFAFAAERLAIGAASIYRQILGFMGIFLGTFAVLYLTHPAFALASAPIIIFLAFVIILLSGFVIAMVMGRFKHELKALQGLSGSAHTAGGGGTTFAAVIIGISGMRNRPLKTGLTVATVTLLTFTILVFGSFQSSRGVDVTYVGKGKGQDRVEFHTPNLLQMPASLVATVRTLFDDRFFVHERKAVLANPAANRHTDDALPIALSADGTVFPLRAVLGLDPAEADRLGLPFPRLREAGRPLYLSQEVARRLGVTVGAEVRLRGQAFTLVGIFDPVHIKSLDTIDGIRLVPPDYESTLAAANVLAGSKEESNLLRNMDLSTVVYTPPDLVAVAPVTALEGLDAVTNTIVLYPRPGADVAAGADELAPLVNGPVYSTTGDGAHRHYFTTIISGSGYLELVVPLLLGGLIIFSSLLGSIVDRQKEIFTFSALGLAPKDVGTLFFAESAVIAVLGGMGGYLLGQIVSKGLSIAAGFGLLTVPEMNFSGFSSLVTILIVMGMVMLSTIYPALMAGRSANPGVNRSWRMPKPEGDLLEFTFPFTVPAASFAGILGFIREHFANHGDASLDTFSAREIALVPQGEGRTGIRADIALAPFDLGVMQRFEMRTRPSDIAGIDEVVVRLTRLNGSPGTWIKGNRAFIDDLREQFLVWRSLPPSSVEHYQQTTAEALAALKESDRG